MTSTQIAALIAIVLGLIQIVFAEAVAKANVRIATWQGGPTKKIFGNPASAPLISRITGVLFVAIGIYGWFAGQ